MEYAQTAYRLMFTQEVEVSRATKPRIPTIPPAGVAPSAEAVMKAERERQGIFIDAPKLCTIKVGTVLYSSTPPDNATEVDIDASEGDFWGDLYTYFHVPRDSFQVEKVSIPSR